MNRALPAVLAVLLAACPGPAKPPAPPAPGSDTPPPASDARSFDLEDNHLVLPSPVVFEGNELDAASSDDALQHILAFLDAKADVTLVRIEGHTDGVSSGGSDDDELDFSGDRALAVARWLTAHGVDCNRMIVAAFGGSKPIADPDTPEGRAQNRRIEVVVAALRGTLIGGMPADGGAPAAVPACD